MRPLNPSDQPTFILWRYLFILSFIGIIVIILTWRVCSLSMWEKKFLESRGKERSYRLVNLPAFRGMILDRNLSPLAISTTVYSIWVNPQEFYPDQQRLNELSTQLKIPKKDILLMTKNYRKNHRGFLYLKRGLEPETALYIKSLKIAGLYIQSEYKRFYPEAEITSHVVGFTNIDDQGQEGLELAYDNWLKGDPGKKWVMKDRLGRIIADLDTIKEQKSGMDLVLSIDRRIQYLAYRALSQTVKEHKAQSGSAVVLDVLTGEILAMVNQPDFNPNNRRTLVGSQVRNRAVTDAYEPGSTLKALSMASALASNKYQPNCIIDTSPGWMKVDHNIVRDLRNYGLLSLASILKHSSNIGIAKLILSLPPNHLWETLHKIGFGEITGISYPGESSGSLLDHADEGPFMIATLSFGYGMTATLLQIVRAYAILANGGVKLPVSLLKVTKSPQGERVFSTQLSKDMLHLLSSVVLKGGTGTKGYVPGYQVAGKTGTTEMVAKKGGYDKNHFIASFVGIGPLKSPRIVVGVMVKNPQTKEHSGGLVAGPIFSQIMEGSLHLLNVPRDEGF